MPIDSAMLKRAVRAFDAAMDGHRGLGTGDYTAMRAALEASGLPDQNARLVTELSDAKKEITDTEDRLAAIERQVRELADGMNTAPIGTYLAPYAVAQKLRAIIDTQKDGDDG